MKEELEKLEKEIQDQKKTIKNFQDIHQSKVIKIVCYNFVF
jgi:D-mannonate dehydratase